MPTIYIEFKHRGFKSQWPHLENVIHGYLIFSFEFGWTFEPVDIVSLTLRKIGLEKCQKIASVDLLEPFVETVPVVYPDLTSHACSIEKKCRM